MSSNIVSASSFDYTNLLEYKRVKCFLLPIIFKEKQELLVANYSKLTEMSKLNLVLVKYTKFTLFDVNCVQFHDSSPIFQTRYPIWYFKCLTQFFQHTWFNK